MADLKLDLSPHPLVAEIAAGFIGLGVPLEAGEELKAAIQVARAHPRPPAPEAGSQTGADGQGGPEDPLATVKLGLAVSLAGSAALPELVTFTGYVGATVPADRKTTETVKTAEALAAAVMARAEAATDTDVADDTDAPPGWCVLYLDTRLLTWLLVQEDGIVYRDAVTSHHAPCGVQDVLWVKADTPVGGGSGSLSVEAQFLTGGFTRAGDFGESPPGGGTLAASTGVFCEARSIGCCRPKTPQKP